jgi:hypothetical protein
MMLRQLTFVLCMAALPAHAADRFGRAGQIVPGGTFSLGRERSAVQGIPSQSTVFGSLAPSLQYFVIDDLALGGAVGVSYVSIPDANYYGMTFSAAPSIAYNVPLGPSLSVLPQASFGVAHDTAKIEGAPAEHSNALWVSLYVPLLLHVEHVFFGIGPQCARYTRAHHLSSSGATGVSQTAWTVSLSGMVGAWF